MRFVLVCAASSFLAFGLIGCESESSGGGGSFDPGLYEPLCEKIANSNCSKKPDKKECMETATPKMEGLFANTDCADSYNAVFNCLAKKGPVVCDNEGVPSFSDDACEAESEAAVTCLEKYVEDPKCAQWCDKINAAHCTEGPDTNECDKNCTDAALLAVMSKECWPKLQSFLDCSSKTDHTCDAENEPIAIACQQMQQDFRNCIFVEYED